MTIEKHTWTTTFETANETMTVNFKFRKLKFIAYFKTSKGLVFKGDKIIDEFHLTECKDILPKLAQLAKEDAILHNNIK